MTASALASMKNQATRTGTQRASDVHHRRRSRQPQPQPEPVKTVIRVPDDQRAQLLAQVGATASVIDRPYFRHYRAVAVDRFTSASPDVFAIKGMDAAERAERDLRSRLEAGQIPQVMLVSPERARKAVIGRGGHVSNVFAWRADTDPRGLSAIWTHSPHVTAELDAHSTIPDPVSRIYAERGSVAVRSGRLRRLLVSPWLAPVVSQLASRYEIPVVVHGAVALPPARPVGEGSAVVREALPYEGVSAMLAIPPTPERFEMMQSDQAQGIWTPRPYSTPRKFEAVVATALGQLSEHFGADVNLCNYQICEYLPGDEFEQHTDRYDAAASSWDRTVSFSLLLSEPGVDFEGGEFEVNGISQGLRRGDLIGFTALTPHAVRKVTAGRRMVLIAFGEWCREGKAAEGWLASRA